MRRLLIVLGLALICMIFTGQADRFYGMREEHQAAAFPVLDINVDDGFPV
jgi:hypothetical protein